MAVDNLESLLFDQDKALDWVRTFLTVPTEEGRIIPFPPTEFQKLVVAQFTGRDITIKPRQIRASSIIQARNVRRMTTHYGLNAVICTQTDEMTQMFRDRIKHHLNDLAEKDLKYEITKDNEDTLVLGRMQNRYVFSSAEQKTGPRGIHTAHIVHFSEFAHWPHERAKNILGAVLPACPPPPHGWFDIESTPNGAEGLFYDYAMDARPFNPMSMWTTHFYPWWLERTYTIESYGSLFDVEELQRGFHPTKDEQRLMAEQSLDINKVLWRRVQAAALLKTGKFFSQEYPEDISSCFLTVGANFFSDPTDDTDHIAYYRRLCQDPMLVLTELPYKTSLVSLRGPNLRAWEAQVPGAAYAMFMDTSAGFSGGEASDSDYTSLVVVDAKTSHHVATLRLRTSPERAGEMACAIGQFYNMAYLGIERNSYGASAIQRALELRYPNLFYDIINEPKNPRPGWYTTETSRDKMLRALRVATFEHSFITHDLILVLEMGAFTWTKVNRGERMWKAEARSGAHDDVLMSVAGALAIAKYAPTRTSRTEVDSDGVVRQTRRESMPWLV